MVVVQVVSDLATSAMHVGLRAFIIARAQLTTIVEMRAPLLHYMTGLVLFAVSLMVGRYLDNFEISSLL